MEEQLKNINQKLDIIHTDNQKLKKVIARIYNMLKNLSKTSEEIADLISEQNDMMGIFSDMTSKEGIGGVLNNVLESMTNQGVDNESLEFDEIEGLLED